MTGRVVTTSLSEGRRSFGGVGEPHELGEPQRPERQGPGVLHPPVAEVGELEAAAADVDERAVLDGQTVDRPAEREPCLLVATDDVDVETRPRAQGVDELGPVGRFPHRRRGERDGAARS